LLIHLWTECSNHIRQIILNDRESEPTDSLDILPQILGTDSNIDNSHPDNYTVDLKIYSEQTDTLLINTLTNKSYIAL
jgi:hypothetical protein